MRPPTTTEWVWMSPSRGLTPLRLPTPCHSQTPDRHHLHLRPVATCGMLPWQHWQGRPWRRVSLNLKGIPCPFRNRVVWLWGRSHTCHSGIVVGVLLRLASMDWGPCYSSCDAAMRPVQGRPQRPSCNCVRWTWGRTHTCHMRTAWVAIGTEASRSSCLGWWNAIVQGRTAETPCRSVPCRSCSCGASTLGRSHTCHTCTWRPSPVPPHCFLGVVMPMRFDCSSSSQSQMTMTLRCPCVLVGIVRGSRFGEAIPRSMQTMVEVRAGRLRPGEAVCPILHGCCEMTPANAVVVRPPTRLHPRYCSYDRGLDGGSRCCCHHPSRPCSWETPAWPH
eukprot:m.67030 g.67030  ORF g.67030 m.67030 type:complete len:333 (+) comp8404_c0_seq3:379-1377(+)